MKSLLIYASLIVLSIPLTDYLTSSLQRDVQRLEEIQSTRYEVILTTSTN